MIDIQQLSDRIDATWQNDILPSLCDYIEIPAQSPLFDPDWQETGHLEDACQHLFDWLMSHQPTGSHCEVRRLPGLTPTIVMTLPGSKPGNVLLYGHFDKQPEFTGWHDGLGPWQPVEREGRLYGRGGADDGYALYAAIAAINALQEQAEPLPDITVLIESSEESGSPHLEAYLNDLATTIGTPDLVIALDSTCGDYERLWITTSLRGMVIGDLRVDVLSEGAHSGVAGGVMPSSFRILRQLLSRVEDEDTGTILPDFLCDQVPAIRHEQAQHAAEILGDGIKDSFASIASPVSTDPVELILNNTWQASLEITGADGLPDTAKAGNVLRPGTQARMALRLPPTIDAEVAARALRKLLEDNAPNDARVTFEHGHPNPGWHSPPLTKTLAAAINAASQHHFGEDCAYLGCGGSIPFMKALAERAPRAQFVVTGVLGPMSNAHGPNEFLHLQTARSLTKCVAEMLAADVRPG